MEKDKEILFNEDTAKKLADMVAKALMPDISRLEELGELPPHTIIDIDTKNWTWTMNKQR